jgi:hypothetical protein
MPPQAPDVRNRDPGARYRAIAAVAAKLRVGFPADLEGTRDVAVLCPGSDIKFANLRHPVFW